MSECTFQIRSRELCEQFSYHQVGGYDSETGLAWACKKNITGMFHIFVADGQPAYEHTYIQVTKFQEGYACAKDNSGLWQFHICPDGLPAYCNTFLNVGLFFEGLADATDENGQFHITTNGVPAYDERYERVGHFCHGLAQAMDSTGHFHIKPDGTPAYSLRGLRNGPYNDKGIAWTEIIQIVDGEKREVRILIDVKGEIIE